MNICPICLYVNTHTADICEYCKKHRFRNGIAVAVDSGGHLAPSSHALPTRANGSLSTVTRPSNAVKQAEILRAPIPTPLPLPGGWAEPPKSTSQSEPQASSGENGEPIRTILRVVLKPKLELVRGERLGTVYPILEGKNIVGRTVNQPVDIDLTGMERQEQVWTSRQHALITFDGRAIVLEDLKSLNGTFVNRVKLHPGQQRALQPNDIIQVGTVQLRVLILAEKIASE